MSYLPDLRYGQVLPAGLWETTVLADMDFETYSEAGYVFRPEDGAYGKWGSLAGCSKTSISAVGAAAYAEHPSTEILSLAYNLKDGRGAQLWLPGMSAPQDLFDHLAAGKLMEAWNSFFEYMVWNYVGHLKLGWPAIDYRLLRDAAAKSRAYSLPGKLAIAAGVVGTKLKDTKKGGAVIRRYCVPKQPTKNNRALRRLPSEEPQGVELYQYNLSDIEAEASVSLAVPDLSPFETEVWLLDQAVNIRGVKVDMPAVHAIAQILDRALEENNRRLAHVTNYQLQATTEAQRMLDWLHGRGVHLDTLEDDNITEALKRVPRESAEAQVLRIRQASSSAGVKKIYALTRMANSDDRVRGTYQYYRAITGRWSNEGLQLQNMVSSGPDMGFCSGCNGWYPSQEKPYCPVCKHDVFVPTGDPVEWNGDVMATCIDMLSDGVYEHAFQYFGDELLGIIAASVRGLLIADRGRDFLCSDYSSIEAVVLAILAQEQWRIEVFRTHGKIYEKTLSDITGIPFEEILAHKKQTGQHHKLRKPLGKIPELASGYGGWIGAWVQFGADEYMSEPEIKENILKWRAKSPAIVEFWGGQWRKHPERWEWTHEYHGLEGAFCLALLHPGSVQQVGPYIRFMYSAEHDVLFCRLPSGRCLSYHQPRLEPIVDRAGNDAFQLSHMVYNTNPKKGIVGRWVRVTTYGGMLAENVTQAVARDLLAHGALNAERAGYEIVIHVHDEIVAEVPEGWGSVEELEALMMDLPDWARDWPVKAAGGWRGKRYKKE